MTNKNIREKYRVRLDELINKWDALRQEASFDSADYWKYYERSKSLLKELCSDTDEFLQQLGNNVSQYNIERFIGKLRATVKDWNKGYLHPEWLIQDNETLSLMEQAESLLSEGADSKYKESKNLPAAIVTGIALERFLRQLCERREPPIPTMIDDERFKMLGVIKNELELAGAFDDDEKRMLKGWIEIRNHAAHGYFKKFTREEVIKMIEGVKAFIEKYKYRS